MMKSTAYYLKNKKLSFGIIVILIITLPILVWSIVAGRFDIRRYAQQQPAIINNFATGQSCEQLCFQQNMTCHSIGTSNDAGNSIFRNASGNICQNENLYDSNNPAAGCERSMLDKGITDTAWSDGRNCQWTYCRCTGETSYSLTPLPSQNITMPVSEPDTVYGISVILRRGDTVMTDQRNVTYDWSIDNPSIATVTPWAPEPAPGEPCNTYGVLKPCPQSQADIRALQLGATLIRVTANVASSPSGPITLVSTTFNINVASVLNRPIKIKVKLKGIESTNYEKANGSTVFIRFLKGNQDLYVQPLPNLNHAGNGIFEANINVSEASLPAGSGYRVIIKAAKHLGKKFCRISGQTQPCNFTDTITIQYTNNPVVFDFTGMPLEPGDIAPQDGKADIGDYNKIKAQMNKICPTTVENYNADEAYKAADINYSGCVNITDVGLLRQTLETRYDEN